MKIVVKIILMSLLFYSCKDSQEISGDGSIKGQIKFDLTEYPLDLPVSATDQIGNYGDIASITLMGGDKERVVVADSLGNYEFMNVPIGVYDLEVASEGFYTHVSSQVMVYGGIPAIRDVILAPQIDDVIQLDTFRVEFKDINDPRPGKPKINPVDCYIDIFNSQYQAGALVLFGNSPDVSIDNYQEDKYIFLVNKSASDKIYTRKWDLDTLLFDSMESVYAKIYMISGNEPYWSYKDPITGCNVYTNLEPIPNGVVKIERNNERYY